MILGDQALTATQATMFSNWVNGGRQSDRHAAGQADLHSLLGVTAAGGTLANAYFQVDTSAAPGAGIVAQTMQFHGTADRYTLSGATAVATLYSDASTATANPAVTMRSVGSNGGHAAAFAFDLARSVVYTRQGNPAWAGDSRDGQDGPIRSDNLFFGAKPGDVQPDWIDFTKVAIPQADEQQRLLANLIGTINLPRKPLPRFWYFPKGKKAAVIMTGDDHAGGGTAGRFDAYKAASTAGCSVADWDCIRSTSYVYPNAPLTDSQAVGYEADGFEVALHVTTGCVNFTPSSLETNFADQIAAFTAKYSSVAPPATNRTHCIPWSDWSTHPKTELAHGIRLDTNYYYWPPAWIADRPGMFTGSGMPMRFADLDGTMIDVYQATTQMTDESGQTFPKNINALLDKATGAEGYYGAFTANMHTDSAGSSESDAIVASAKAHGVPVVSSRQMLTWLDGRNGSSFQSLAWAGDKLSFTISLGAGASNLQAMVPTVSAAGGLTGITRGGAPVSFTNQTIKGVVYAFVSALPGGVRGAVRDGRRATGSAIDTTVADFSAGTLDANTRISQVGDGEVILAGAVNEEFGGSSLPPGWSFSAFSPGGVATVSGGSLVVDGADAATDASYGPGRALDFVATFGSAQFQHVGFVNALAFDGGWAIFSTKDTTGLLYARTSDGQNTLVTGSNLLNSPHLFRIEWNASNVLFYLDGTLVATHAVSIAGPLRPLASDLDPGGPTVSVDWFRMTPYVDSGSFTSRVFDAGTGGSWSSISSTSDLPAGTSIALSVRSGATPVPDGSWSAFTAVPGSGGPLSSTSRYLQYSAALATSDPLQTPALRDVTVGFTVSSVTHTLTVTRTGTGAATSTVTSTPAGINCGATCVKTFDDGTVVTLLPTPGATYIFGGWSGDPDCADGVVTLDADKTCTATFNKKPDLTVSALRPPRPPGPVRRSRSPTRPRISPAGPRLRARATRRSGCRPTPCWTAAIPSWEPGPCRH